MNMAVLNPFNLTSDYEMKFDCPYLGADKDTKFKVIVNDQLIIMQNVMAPLFGQKKYEDIPGFSIFQIDLPLSSANWLVDCIENKFWKSAAQGGLPSGVNSYEEDIEGENLALYRQMNVEAENQKGFLLTNFSRPSPVLKNTNYQDFYLTDWMLIDGKLLDFLKTL